MKTDQDKIVERESILEEAYERALEEMYALSQPPCNYKEVKEEANKKFNETGEKTNIIDCHYLPQNLYEMIIEKYMDAYHIENDFYDHCDIISSYMREGGTKEKYVKEEGQYSGYRDYETIDKLSDMIGEENAKKVFEYIEEAKKFYRFNKEESAFKFSLFNFAPTTNKEVVKKYWKDQGVDVEFREYNDGEAFELVYYGNIEDEYEDVDFEDE